MKPVQKPKLTLSKKTVTVLSNQHQQQIQGGANAQGAYSAWQSFWECNTITCCSVPACSLWDCEIQL
ncbi:hypothetical protein FAM09_23595 [Niastella caeni]|uniref:Uncharacterized protein n=1 Tax=Niastella caeni TaxID=2569763 RepID=A0A4V6T3P0_9BACT|nr:class I lanthipeptide [Niastella caeni]THU34976.1 hypothetical protein FAM09_23595 [Niastella caeni]